MTLSPPSLLSHLRSMVQASEESEWFDEHKEEQVLDRYTLLAFFDSTNAQCMHTMENEVTNLVLIVKRHITYSLTASILWLTS